MPFSSHQKGQKDAVAPGLTMPIMATVHVSGLPSHRNGRMPGALSPNALSIVRKSAMDAEVDVPAADEQGLRCRKSIRAEIVRP